MDSTGKQLFLNLTVDSPDGKHFDVPNAGIKEFWIIEDINQLVPVCTFNYSETYSEFSELFPLMGNETLSVDLGKSVDKYRSFKFKYFSYVSGAPAMLARSKTIQTNWIDSDFAKLRQYPASFNYTKTAASTVAQMVSKGIPIDIEGSKGTCDYFLNNKVVGEALKDLAYNAHSSDGSSFIFCKNGNKYKFQSRNTYMRQPTKCTYTHGYNMTYFNLNGNQRALFTNPESEVVGYSYEKGQIFTISKQPKDLKSTKASFGKSLPFSEGTDISPRFVYDGTRDSHVAEGRASTATESYMDSAMRATMIGLGESSISCGDVIEITIGSSLPSLGTKNMTVSGKWLVEKVIHHVSDLNYQVKLTLAKSNMDFSRRKNTL